METEYTITKGRMSLETEVDGKTHIITADVEDIAIKATRTVEFAHSWVDYSQPLRVPSGPVEYSMEFVANDKGNAFTIRSFDKKIPVEHNISVTIEPTTAEIESARVRVGAPRDAYVDVEPVPPSSNTFVYTINATSKGTKAVERKRVTFSWTEMK